MVGEDVEKKEQASKEALEVQESMSVSANSVKEQSLLKDDSNESEDIKSFEISNCQNFGD